MHFEFTDEQQMLHKVASDFVEKTCPPRVAKEWDESFTYPEALFRSMGELGWFALPFPEQYGGSSAGPMEVVIIGEQLGRASFDIAMAYVANLVGAINMFNWASESQRAEFFPDILAGRRRISTGISEPDSGSDAAALRTFADDHGDHFVVNGRKMWCTGAGLPNTTLALYVRTDRQTKKKHDGISLVYVDPSAPGLEMRPVPTLARHILQTYELVLDDVIVPKENLVGPINQGWKVLLSSLELERVLISAGYVGAAQETITDALEYAKQRKQFGQPIGNFQSLAHALADLQTEVDAARLLVYRAAWKLANGAPSFREGSMAKLFASETYVKAARWGMQIWGGYGFSTESVMSFRYRESIVATISGGTSQVQRNEIARTMGLRTYRDVSEWGS